MLQAPVPTIWDVTYKVQYVTIDCFKFWPVFGAAHTNADQIMLYSPKNMFS